MNKKKRKKIREKKSENFPRKFRSFSVCDSLVEKASLFFYSSVFVLVIEHQGHHHTRLHLLSSEKAALEAKPCRKDGVYAIINHSFSLFCKCYCFDLSFNLIWKNQSLASNFSILVRMKLKNVVIYKIDISFGPSTIKSNLDHDKP